MRHIKHVLLEESGWHEIKFAQSGVENAGRRLDRPFRPIGNISSTIECSILVPTTYEYLTKYQFMESGWSRG